MSAKANIKRRRGIEPLTRGELVTLNSIAMGANPDAPKAAAWAARSFTALPTTTLHGVGTLETKKNFCQNKPSERSFLSCMDPKHTSAACCQ